MRQDNLGWKRWLVPVGLVLACLLIAVGALTGRVAARQTAPPLDPPGEQIEPPSAQEEALWAAVGLNDAWYIANGYTENPPPSAPSPFWPETTEATDRSEILATPIIEEPRASIDPPNVVDHAVSDDRKLLSAAALCGSENNYCEDYDTFGTAYGPLGVGVTYQAYPDDVDDYYYFELSAADMVVVDVTDFAPTSSNGTVMLYGPANGEDPGETIDYYGPRGHSSMLLEPHLLGQGKYFVWVYTASSYTTTQLYDLTVTARSERNYLPLALRHFKLNHPPFIPTSPQPSGGATDQGVNVSLKWTGGDPDGDSLTYDVFLEANDNTPDVLVCDDTTSASCNPGALSYEANYYWQVIARDSEGVATPGPVWSFTTQKPLAEVRAIWVTRFDWTSAAGHEGPEDIDEIVANVANAGFNTIFFQIRGTGDAYYRPGLEPWSRRLNNGQVLGQDPGWDPLGTMIEKAHARGVQVHAYVNMYPTWLDNTPPSQAATPQHPYWTWSSVHGEVNWRQWHKDTGPMGLRDDYYLWASPGVDAVRDHIVAVVSDIVSRYNVDGVHLDLVRYANSPYSYDPISNAAIESAGADRGDWQRDRITGLVSRIHSAIGQIRPGTRLSAAVWFCYYADGCLDVPYRLSSGYATFYQDSLGWLEAGVIDAIAPMLYTAAAFQHNSYWREVMLQFQDPTRIAGRHVYPGISGNLSSFSDIATRIQYARDAGAAGHAIFSYGAVDQHGYWDDFANGPYSQPATHTSLP